MIMFGKLITIFIPQPSNLLALELDGVIEDEGRSILGNR